MMQRAKDKLIAVVSKSNINRNYLILHEEKIN